MFVFFLTNDHCGDDDDDDDDAASEASSYAGEEDEEEELAASPDLSSSILRASAKQLAVAKLGNSRFFCNKCLTNAETLHKFQYVPL